MWKLKKNFNDRNELLYRNRPTRHRKKLMATKGERRQIRSLGLTYTHFTVYKIDQQQRSTESHGELDSIFHTKLQGKRL